MLETYIYAQRIITHPPAPPPPPRPRTPPPPGGRPREVHELATELELGQATVSQHLAAMRSVGLVEADRDGRSVRYRLADAQILAACALMRDVIVRRLSALGSIAAAARRLDLESAAPPPPPPHHSPTHLT